VTPPIKPPVKRTPTAEEVTMSTTYDHNGEPAGLGKLQINKKDVETVDATQWSPVLPKNVPMNEPRHYLKFLGSCKTT
jgi:hypothetical protein